MTGFARAEGGAPDCRWVWEVRSVNGRNLDLRCRLPGGLDALEPAVRAAVGEHCRRGNLTATLTLTRISPTRRLRVDREALDRLLQLMTELQDRVRAEPPRLDGLLAVPGIVDLVDEEESEEARAARSQAMMGDLERALEELAAMRRQEGERLARLAEGHLDEIERLAAAAAATSATQPERLLARLKTQLEALTRDLAAVSADRLAQEAALLVARSDIREELDRLAAHAAAARGLIRSGGPVGRRLDFLCQELNREANTLCSKSAEVELTTLGLGLKAAIEQLREQVQNIE